MNYYYYYNSPQDTTGQHLSLSRQRLGNGLFAVDAHRCVVLFVHNALHTWILLLLLLRLLLLVSISIGLDATNETRFKL